MNPAADNQIPAPRTPGGRRWVRWGLPAAVLAAAGVLGWWGADRRGARWVNTLGMELVRIPAGETVQGSTPDEREWALAHGARPEWVEAEQERGTARVPRDYWMGKTEVTEGEYRRFVDATGYRTVAERNGGPLALVMSRKRWIARSDRSWAEPGFPHGGTHPAVCLNWRDGAAFCRWLTEQERAAGRIGPDEVYRLPLESEWERACRNGGDTRYAWGDAFEDLARHANILDATPLPDGSRWEVPTMDWTDGHALTAPVGSFRPTGRGLVDLHGNVWEWCRRDRAEGKTQSSHFVMRGGSWDNTPGNARCASRRPAPPKFASDTTGFRVVLAKAD